MASYDIEHSIPSQSTEPPSQRRRPDLSTFYSSLSNVDTSSVSNANALPTPGDVAASYRLLGQGMEAIMVDNPNTDLVESMMEYMHELMQAPPERPRGLSEEYINGLERVEKKRLKKDDVCPICGDAFLDDEYPLVVRLECKGKHMYCLQCIEPWFKLQSTCPVDRQDLAPPVKEKKKPPEDGEGEDVDENYDDMYA